MADKDIPVHALFETNEPWDVAFPPDESTIFLSYTTRHNRSIGAVVASAGLADASKASTCERNASDVPG